MGPRRPGRQCKCIALASYFGSFAPLGTTEIGLLMILDRMNRIYRICLFKIGLNSQVARTRSNSAEGANQDGEITGPPWTKQLASAFWTAACLRRGFGRQAGSEAPRRFGFYGRGEQRGRCFGRHVKLRSAKT